MDLRALHYHQRRHDKSSSSPAPSAGRAATAIGGLPGAVALHRSEPNCVPRAPREGGIAHLELRALCILGRSAAGTRDEGVGPGGNQARVRRLRAWVAARRRTLGIQDALGAGAALVQGARAR